jgi:DNA-binding IscR family transcriptional regulator
MLHVLIHMGKHERRATSAQIAKMLNTNAVVVRRTMAGLREHGYVRSETGHGGGWTLACTLEELTLLDVYKALGEPPIFALGQSGDHAKCLVEQAVNAALGDALGEAEALLRARFGSVTLAELARSFDKRLRAAEKRSR